MTFHLMSFWEYATALYMILVLRIFALNNRSLDEEATL
jgi:hypothetical protein